MTEGRADRSFLAIDPALEAEVAFTPTMRELSCGLPAALGLAD